MYERTKVVGPHPYMSRLWFRVFSDYGFRDSAVVNLDGLNFRIF